MRAGMVLHYQEPPGVRQAVFGCKQDGLSCLGRNAACNCRYTVPCIHQSASSDRRAAQAFLLDDYLAIVSEYAALGDLADYIDARRTRTRQSRGLSESQARQFFQQLMLAVDFWCALGRA